MYNIFHEVQTTLGSGQRNIVTWAKGTEEAPWLGGSEAVGGTS